MRSADRAERAATTPRPTASPTSRRSAWPEATKSSSCTAPPTARSSPRSTPRPIRATSKHWCSTRSCRRTGPNRSTARLSPPFRASFASCARGTRVRASPRTPPPISPTSSGAWASADGARAGSTATATATRSRSPPIPCLKRSSRVISNPPCAPNSRRRSARRRTATTPRWRGCWSARARAKKAKPKLRRKASTPRSTTRQHAKRACSRGAGPAAPPRALKKRRLASRRWARARSGPSQRPTCSISQTFRRAPSGPSPHRRRWPRRPRFRAFPR